MIVPRGSWHRSALLCAALVAAACNCGEPEPAPRDPVGPPVVNGSPDPASTAQPDEAPWPDDPRRVTVHHTAELTRHDPGLIEELALALSAADRVGYVNPSLAADPCLGLDLLRLASAAPRLKKLRIAGCQAAVQAGLGSFAGTLETLELSDIALDGVTLGRLGQLESLKELTLRRVELGSDVLKPLRKLKLQSLTLADLNKDSDVSLMLDMWPKSLTHVSLEGEWASHKAMLTLAKADALETLEIRDTRIGNFSLNQIKPLENLKVIEFRGPTFNDNSPLYFRELPVYRFTCACSKMGDAGLRSLRHSSGVRELILVDTQVTGEGLAALEDLQQLRRVTLRGLDPGSSGFEALAKFPKLSHLELEGTLEHPDLENLGLLVALEHLSLRYPGLDDRAMPQLEALRKLRELDLSRTRVSDDGLAALATLENLEVLKLHHTRVTNTGLEHIGKLSSLRVLELDHTDVVDAGVARLVGLANLEELRLDSTLVTDDAVQHIIKLRALRRLNVGNTVLTKGGATPLTELPALEALGLFGIRD